MRLNNLKASDRVSIARNPERPGAAEYIKEIFTDFIPLCGDRRNGEDESVLGGIAMYRGIPVTVIGIRKGRNLEENMKYRFGMPNPEGYRKAQRLMKQAEKFGRPVITFIDTPGAYPGIEAEAGGQGQAIAESIAIMSALKVPTVAVFTGEGGSGGALALSVSDRIIMLENSIFSILSPEGFASILWKDSAKWEEACDVMKLTAPDLKEYGICDYIVPEGEEGAKLSDAYIYSEVDKTIFQALKSLEKKSGETLVKERYRKLRNIGNMRNRKGKN